MKKIASSLTKHLVLIVVEKKPRALLMQNVLERMGHKSNIALSLYDALQSIQQELPHVVISESNFQDGNAAILFDRIKEIPHLQNIPILLYLTTKSKEELKKLVKKKFSGILLAKLDPKTFIEKISASFENFNNLSPYFIDFNEQEIEPEINITIQAKVIGKSNNFIITTSHTELDQTAEFNCSAADSSFEKCILSKASNLKNDDEFYNLFPVNRISGKGRRWLINVPELIPGSEVKERNIYYVSEKQENHDEFIPFLKSKRFRTTYFSDIPSAQAEIKKSDPKIDCIFIEEPNSKEKTASWESLYNELIAESKCPLLVSTYAKGKRSSPYIRYIQYPFGLGFFFEALNAGCQKAQELSDAYMQSSYSGIDVQFQTSGKILALDEKGGVIELKFPILPGGEIIIDHEFLQKVWEENNSVTIKSISRSPDRMVNSLQIRFEKSMSGTSLSKSWIKVLQTLKSFKESEE